MKSLIPKDNKALIISGAALALIIPFFLFAYLPKHRAVNELKAQVKALDQQIGITESMVGDLSRLSQVLADMQKELVSFENKLPDKGQTSLVISEFSSLAQRSSIEVAGIKPQEPRALLDKAGKPITLGERTLKTMRVEMKLLGTYKAVAEYIKGIQEGLSFLVTIDELHIRRDENRAPQLDIKLLFTVYIADKK